MAKKSKRKSSSSGRKSKNKSLAVTALILNILFPLGIGSMIGGKTKTGIWQAILFVIGAIIWIIYDNTGSILCTVSWIWGIVTGIQLVNESR